VASEGGTTTGRGSARGEATRVLLVEAAIDTLRDHGFAGASARVIADRAGVNQGLIFYHFDSVVGLLLAALDTVSATRLARYGEAVAGVTGPAELVEVASAIFREDLDAGHVAVLVAMISGAASTPGLGEEVARRIGPWTGFARDAIDSVLADSPMASVLPTNEVAFAVVALYLGMELLTTLDGDRAPADALFARVGLLAGLFAGLPGPAGGATGSEVGP
jgi:AcrR family transcriptional regulator